MDYIILKYPLIEAGLHRGSLNPKYVLAFVLHANKTTQINISIDKPSQSSCNLSFAIGSTGTADVTVCWLTVIDFISCF